MPRKVRADHESRAAIYCFCPTFTVWLNLTMNLQCRITCIALLTEHRHNWVDQMIIFMNCLLFQEYMCFYHLKTLFQEYKLFLKLFFRKKKFKLWPHLLGYVCRLLAFKCDVLRLKIFMCSWSASTAGIWSLISKPFIFLAWTLFVNLPFKEVNFIVVQLATYFC